MNKGFAHYFKQAFKISVKTIWKSANFFKSVIYFFTTMLARLFVFTGAMSSLADVKQAKIAREHKAIDIPQSFGKASHRAFWTMTVAVLIELFIYLGGFLLVSIGCGLIFSIGFLISKFVTAGGIIIYIFAAPCLIIYLIYSIIIITIFSPTAYVVETNPNLSAGDVVTVCVNSMKSRGKMTVFLCTFIPALVILAVAALCGGGFFLIAMLCSKQVYFAPVMLIWGMVSLAIMGITLPMFILTKNLALVSLFEDIALDPVNANKRTSGINIKKISGAKLDREEVADNLTALFDDAIEEMYPEPEDLVHKHKKKKRRKVAAQSAPAPQPKPQPSPQPQPQPAPTEEKNEVPQDVDDYADETASAAPATEQPAQQDSTAPAQAEGQQSSEGGEGSQS